MNVYIFLLIGGQIMSHEANTVWLESFMEALDDACYIANGNSHEGKYQSEVVLRVIFDTATPSDNDVLGYADEATPSECARALTRDFEDWWDAEKSEGGTL